MNQGDNLPSLISQNFFRESTIYAPDVHELVDHVMTQIISLQKKSKGPENEVPEDKDNEELFQLLGKEYLRNLVLETYKKLSSFTAGQEGEVYKIDLGFKKLLLLKKRLRHGSSNEFELHKTIYQITKKSNSQVKVPVPIDSFIDGENELILMEYVNGKTLYNLVWQSIIQNILLRNIAKYIKNNADGVLISNIKGYNEKYLIDGKIDFENDSICEEGVLELLYIMYQSGIIKDNPGSITYNKGKKSYPILEKIYKDNFLKATIFDSIKQKENTIKDIKHFLDEIHNQGFFHRDLGGNPRNIMLEKIGDEYNITIIDFGKSEKLSPGAKSSYYDQFSGAYYDEDNGIVTSLNSLEIEKEETSKSSVSEDITGDIILKATNIGLELTQDFLENNYNFLKNRNSTIKKLYNDLIEGKNKNHGSYIFLKNKLDIFESSSTDKGKKELFIMIHSLTQKEKNKLSEYFNNFLTESKSSKKYKYAKLFIDYINA